jgi:hypothetical protein
MAKLPFRALNIVVWPGGRVPSRRMQGIRAIIMVNVTDEYRCRRETEVGAKFRGN